MSDSISLLRRASSLDISPQFDGYSKVIIHIDDDTQVSAGDDSGRVMELDNPLGTQEMATNLLARLRGYQYQPYNAENALLDPAAEIGDGVSIKDIYGGIYQRSRTFSRLMGADISAPCDEEIDHEYKYESPSERKFKREMGDVRATLLIQSDEIAARVTKTGGNNSSFGWSLLADEFALYSGNKKVFRATSSGIEVDGKITARSGFIGNGSSGFTITATAIYNNLPYYGASQSSGVYIGTNGIQLGQGFRVDSAGNLYATSGTFTGSVRAGSIQYGGENGTFNGAGITPSSIGGGGGSPLSIPVRKGVTGGTNFTLMTENSYTADWVVANHILCKSGGQISGTHYGSWVDANEIRHSPLWSSRNVATGITVTKNGSGYVTDVELTKSQLKYMGY